MALALCRATAADVARSAIKIVEADAKKQASRSAAPSSDVVDSAAGELLAGAKERVEKELAQLQETVDEVRERESRVQVSLLPPASHAPPRNRYATATWRACA